MNAAGPIIGKRASLYDNLGEKGLSKLRKGSGVPGSGTSVTPLPLRVKREATKKTPGVPCLPGRFVTVCFLEGEKKKPTPAKGEGISVLPLNAQRTQPRRLQSRPNGRP